MLNRFFPWYLLCLLVCLSSCGPIDDPMDPIVTPDHRDARVGYFSLQIHQWSNSMGSPSVDTSYHLDATVEKYGRNQVKLPVSSTHAMYPGVNADGSFYKFEGTSDLQVSGGFVGADSIYLYQGFTHPSYSDIVIISGNRL